MAGSESGYSSRLGQGELTYSFRNMPKQWSKLLVPYLLVYQQGPRRNLVVTYLRIQWDRPISKEYEPKYNFQLDDGKDVVQRLEERTITIKMLLCELVIAQLLAEGQLEAGTITELGLGSDNVKVHAVSPLLDLINMKLDRGYLASQDHTIQIPDLLGPICFREFQLNPLLQKWNSVYRSGITKKSKSSRASQSQCEDTTLLSPVGDNSNVSFTLSEIGCNGMGISLLRGARPKGPRPPSYRSSSPSFVKEGQEQDFFALQEGSTDQASSLNFRKPQPIPISACTVSGSSGSQTSNYLLINNSRDSVEYKKGWTYKTQESTEQDEKMGLKEEVAESGLVGLPLPQPAALQVQVERLPDQSSIPSPTRSSTSLLQDKSSINLSPVSIPDSNLSEVARITSAAFNHFGKELHDLKQMQCKMMKSIRVRQLIEVPFDRGKEGINKVPENLRSQKKGNRIRSIVTTPPATLVMMLFLFHLLSPLCSFIYQIDSMDIEAMRFTLESGGLPFTIILDLIGRLIQLFSTPGLLMSFILVLDVVYRGLHSSRM